MRCNTCLILLRLKSHLRFNLPLMQKLKPIYCIVIPHHGMSDKSAVQYSLIWCKYLKHEWSFRQFLWNTVCTPFRPIVFPFRLIKSISTPPEVNDYTSWCLFHVDPPAPNSCYLGFSSVYSTLLGVIFHLVHMLQPQWGHINNNTLL